jgi:hypothetical protein
MDKQQLRLDFCSCEGLSPIKNEIPDNKPDNLVSLSERIDERQRLHDSALYERIVSRARHLFS